MSKVNRAALQNPIAAKRNHDGSSPRARLFALLGHPYTHDGEKADTETGPVRSPPEHLFRIALSLAARERSAQVRRLTADEVEALLDIDEEAEPERRAQELRVLVQAIVDLPDLQRAILMANLLEGLSPRDLARRFGLTPDALDREMAMGLEFSARRLREATGSDSDPGARESSNE